MKRLGDFLRTTLMGGLLVVLPIALTFFLIRWIFNIVSRFIEPITKIIVEQTDTQRIVGDVLAISIIVLVFFLIGLFVKTRLGRYILCRLEKHILKVAPGYSLFKETLKQLIGQDKRPFSCVVLGRVFGNDTLMTGFVADEHMDGRMTVFFPSALNPTTGLLCHLKKEDVIKLDVTVETAMRTIISCGAGASKLFKNIEILD